MTVTFDPAKDRANVRKHGISLSRAADFDFDGAEYRLDDRQDYGENRIRAISFLGGALYVLVFVGDGDSVRAISLRNATKQEYREYAEVR